MIVCPNCNHSNPEGAQSCEACYTPLPSTTNCPNCGAEVQSDATFCGQCGSNLTEATEVGHSGVNIMSTTEETEVGLGGANFANEPGATEVEPSLATDVSSPTPDLMAPEPLVKPDPLVSIINRTEAMPVPETEVSAPNPTMSQQPSSPPPPEPTMAAEPPAAPTPVASPAPSSKTQLQLQIARLLHVQTDTLIELPPNLSVIHIGKPNDRIPPDVDVAGFPNSEIVSRVHADIRVESDAYYIEDVGSANGTYINNLPLSLGNRHRLRAGDRIALGKGDLVTFIFQVS
ncbi:FHA domain-containing protein [Aliterella atlantica]|uniref:FHA domain-containing protein n=1 Tax=Aliterella atlantica CENA595 TaxID=1618023 RepID=A0A0D8ZX70_9CYAN|nr:FHA domain-containing protein [Aliterella atlantica]KJH71806.1 hypothetical protein UH38_10480 [Aliterella atlantica CENA595]